MFVTCSQQEENGRYYKVGERGIRKATGKNQGIGRTKQGEPEKERGIGRTKRGEPEKERGFGSIEQCEQGEDQVIGRTD